MRLGIDYVPHSRLETPENILTRTGGAELHGGNNQNKVVKHF
jgi:hypothetical protein